MSKKFKKILVVLLSALMVLTYMPGMAFADEAQALSYTYKVTSPLIPDQVYTSDAAALNESLKSILSTITVRETEAGGTEGLLLHEGTDFTVEASTTQIGTAYAVFTTKGNYSDKTIEPLSFEIVESPTTDTFEATLDPAMFVYGTIINAEAIKAAKAVRVVKNGNTLLDQDDFRLSVDPSHGSTRAKVGDIYTVTVSAGTDFVKTFDVTIGKKDLKDAKVTADIAAATYDGTPQEPAVSNIQVTAWTRPTGGDAEWIDNWLNGSNVTTLGDSDFTVSYSKNTNATTKAVATVTATATCANFTGSADLEFPIAKATLSNDTYVNVTDKKEVPYTGAAQKPELTIDARFSDTVNAKTIPAADYTVKYQDATDVGENYKIQLVPSNTGNLQGETSWVNAFSIVQADLSTVTFTQKADIPAGTEIRNSGNGANFNTYFEAKLGDYALPAGQTQGNGRVFNVEYTAGKNHFQNIGEECELTLTARTNIQNQNYKGTAKITYKPAAKVLAEKYTASATNITYDGTQKRPSESQLGTVRDADRNVLSTNDFKITNWENNINATTDDSKAIALIEGKGDYEGSKSYVEFNIQPLNAANYYATVTGIEPGSFYVGKEIPGAVVTLQTRSGSNPNYTYTDLALQPTPDDYTVTAATITGGKLTAVNVVMKGNYTGNLTRIHDFVPVDADVPSLDNAVVSDTIPAGLSQYNADTIKAFLTVTINGEEIPATAYTLSANNIHAPANPTVGDEIKIKLTQGAVSGTKEATLKVVQRDIADLATIVTLNPTEYTYNGTERKPTVTIPASGTLYNKALTSGTDFTVSYADNIDAGTATATVEGKGIYKGSVTKTFTIGKAAINRNMVKIVDPSAADRQFKIGPAVDLSAKIGFAAVTTEAYKNYKFSADDFDVKIVEGQTVKATDKATEKHINYTIHVSANSKNYTERTTSTYQNPSWDPAYSYTLAPLTVTDATITVAPNEFVYDATKVETIDAYRTDAALKVKTTVVVDGTTLTEGTDYTVQFKGSAKLPSEYGPEDKAPYAEVTFKGNYAGVNNQTKLAIVKKSIDLSNVKIVPPTEAELIYGYEKVVEGQVIKGVKLEAHDLGKGTPDELPANSFTVKYYDKNGKEVKPNPVNVGTYKAVVTAALDYGYAEGESIEFTINKQVLTDREFLAMTTDLVVGSGIETVYDTEEVTHEELLPVEYYGEDTETPKVYNKSELLPTTFTKSADFEVVKFDKEWDGKAASKGKATIALKANSNYSYDGTVEKTFEWTPGWLLGEPSDYYEIADQEYTGEELEPPLQVKAGKDVELSWATVKYYENNIEIAEKTAKAYVVVEVPETAKNAKYTGHLEGFITFTIKAHQITPEEAREDAEEAEHAAALVRETEDMPDSQKAKVAAAADALAAVLENPLATPEEIEEAVDAVYDAIAEAYAYKDALEDAVAETIAAGLMIMTGDYTDDTVTALTAAIEVLSNVLDDPSATSEDVEDATSFLAAIIEKAQLKALTTVSLADTTVTYNGKAPEMPTPTILGSTGAVTYKYYSDAEGTTEIEAPVNAGKYYAKACVAADAEYRSAESHIAKLTINKAASKISKIKPAKKSVKAGKKFTLKATVKAGDGKVTFKKTSGNKKIKVNKAGKVTVKKGLKKGTYKIKVKATIAATDNYKKATKKATIKVTVK